MEKEQSKKIIEALLFVSDKPISLDALRDVLKEVEPAEIKVIVEELNAEYLSSGRSFAIKEIAGGFQMLTDPVYSRWISALYKRPSDKISGPGLETLAIIAYKQPLTRSQIELIRGVNVDGVLRTLEDRNLIRPRGKLDAPGRPILYGTTTEFLQHFGLRSLDELPTLKEFQECDLDFSKDRNEIINTETGKLQNETGDASPIPQGEAAMASEGLPEVDNNKSETSNADQQIAQNS